MQAVYELSTARPFLPEKARYTLEQLEVYGHGYYQALAAALRVMKPAAKQWEGRMEHLERPRLVTPDAKTRAAAAANQGGRDRVQVIVFWLLVGAGAIFVLELLGLLAAAIYHLVR